MNTTLTKGTENFAHVLQELAANTEEIINETDAEDCPLDVLPIPLRNLVNELSIKYRFPKDFSLACILWMCSNAIGNKYRVRVKKKWKESALLFMCLIARAGETKSPVLDYFSEVLRHIDQASFKKYADELAEEHEARSCATKDSPYKPKQIRREFLMMGDSTPEARNQALFYQPYGVGGKYDEIASLFGNLNAYNKGDYIPTLLSIHSCKEISSITLSREHIYIPAPYHPIIGLTQPAVAKKIFSGNFASNGVFDRFLFVFPTDLKKEIPDDEEISPGLYENYEDLINFILSIRKTEGTEDSFPIEHEIIDYEPEAKILLMDGLRENAKEVNDSNENGDERKASLYSKFDYHLIRLSLILQFIEDANLRRKPSSIKASTVKNAIKLSNYFKVQALRVYGHINSNPLLGCSSAVLQLFETLPKGEFEFKIALQVAKDIRSFHNEETARKWTSRQLKKKDLFIKTQHGFYCKIGGAK